MTIHVYELAGTNTLFDINGVGVVSGFEYWKYIGWAALGPAIGEASTATSYMLNALNPALATHEMVPYPAALFPLSASRSQGKTATINAINTTAVGDKFAMFGWSQGAMVISDVRDEIVSGSLQSRSGDFLGAATFGNGRREAGHTFPNCPDPGGEGVLHGDLLSGSGVSWFDFANPGDRFAVSDWGTGAGKAATAYFDLLMGNWDGTVSSLTDIVGSDGISGVINAGMGLINGLWGLAAGAHLTYGTTTPLAPADTRTCAQIGVDYFHSLALGWDGPTVAPVATATGSGTATVECDIPTLAGTYTYSVSAYDSTAGTVSTPSCTTSVASGKATLTVSGLTVGDDYTFSVLLGTTYSSPSVTPASTMSNSITIT